MLHSNRKGLSFIWLFHLAVLLCAMPSLAFSSDFFPSGHVRAYQPLEVLEPGATAGGYPIFQGHRSWMIVSGGTTTNNLGIQIGLMQLISPIGGDYFAQMTLVTAGGGGETNGYFSADPCATAVQALVKVNKGASRFDNCLVISPQVVTILNKPVTTLFIHIRNSQNNWRLYDLGLLLAVDALGFTEASIADWSAPAVEQDSEKKKFLEKLTAWAKLLQEGVNRAIGYDKPQDAFREVPSLNTLLTLNAMGKQLYFDRNLTETKPAHNAGVSYVYCESQKKMVPEDGKSCPDL